MDVSRFTVERSAFAQLKQAIDSNSILKQEVEPALELLLGRFATSVRENRFVVGGALFSRAVAREILRVAPTLWKALYPDSTPGGE